MHKLAAISVLLVFSIIKDASAYTDVDFFENSVALFIMLVVGIFFFYLGFRQLKKKRFIEDTPTSKIQSLAMGIAELKGTAYREKQLEAPLTKTGCCFYKYIIEKLVKSGKSNTWVTIAEGDSSFSPFHIKDITGSILIDPMGAEFELEPKFRYCGYSYPEVCRAFILRCNPSVMNSFFKPKLRFQEWRIHQNEDIYVLGTAKKTTKLVFKIKETLNDYIRKIKQDKDKMSSYDSNKDGQIDAQEWESAFKQIETEFAQKQLENLDKENLSDDTIIGKGDVDPRFIISDQSEEEICARYHWQVIVFWVLGIGLISSSLYFLAKMFGVRN